MSSSLKLDIHFHHFSEINERIVVVVLIEDITKYYIHQIYDSNAQTNKNGREKKNLLNHSKILEIFNTHLMTTQAFKD